MDLRFGTAVLQDDDGKAGELRRIAIDSETREVVALIVAHGGLGQLTEVEFVVPIDAVNYADDVMVQLQISHEQFDGLKRVNTRNIAPPPDRDHAADLAEDPIDVPDVPPVGAATGVESVGFTPVVEEMVPIPAWDRLIGAESTVWATDGEAGRLTRVSVDDETRRITSLVVKRGEFFTKEAAVPADWIADLQPDTVVLNVGRSQVESVTPQQL